MIKDKRGGDKYNNLSSNMREEERSIASLARSNTIFDRAIDGSGTQNVGSVSEAILDKYFNEAKTSEIIVTDERIGHVKKDHPDEYEFFKRNIRNILSDPDIIAIEKEGESLTHFLLYVKKFDEFGNYKAVISIEMADNNKKNSVISFYPIGHDNEKVQKLEDKNFVIYRKRK